MSDSRKKFVKQKFDDEKDSPRRKQAGGKHSHRRKSYDEDHDDPDYSTEAYFRGGRMKINELINA